MTKLTISIEDERIEKFVFKMIDLIKNTPGVDFNRDGDNYTFKSKNKIEHSISEMEQLTLEDLINEINQSEIDFKKGNFMTSDQFRNEVQSW